MGGQPIDGIRNIALISYTGAGKTSLAEALLFTAKTHPSLGTIGQSNTLSDFEPEEHHRKFSIHTSVLHFNWNGFQGNLLDTPGSSSFLGEAKAALRVADSVLLVVDVVAGLRTEIEKLWSLVQDFKLPCLLFLNGMDKERADWLTGLKTVQQALGLKGLPISIPHHDQGHLDGTVDLLTNQLIRSQHDSSKVSLDVVPDSAHAPYQEARKTLVEGVAETSEPLLERYVTDGDLSTEDLLAGLKQGTLEGDVVPVLCGSATMNIGTYSLLQALGTLLPSPLETAALRPIQGVAGEAQETATRQPVPSDPFSALVFKTLIDPFIGRLTFLRIFSGTLRADSTFLNVSRGVKEKGGHLFTICGKHHTQVQQGQAGEIIAIGKLKDTQTGDTLCDDHHPILFPPLDLPRPVFSFAIEAKSKGDIERVSMGLHKLVEEDPTLQFSRNQETKEMILSGVGQLHIDVTFERLRRKYGADVEVHTPKVPYKETIRSPSEAQGKYKKQTGGHGQYGDCWLKLEPLGRGEGFKFENKIVGGAIPRNFIPAVEKGVHEAMLAGCLAGFPVVDVKVTVYDGSFHAVDSSEMAFKVAASMGFKKAMEQAHPVLLEPIMLVEVVTPDDAVGTVIGDLNAKRGRVLGINVKGHSEVIQAHIPLVEVLRYATSLNAITGGRGTFNMDFDHFEEVPRDLVGKIIEEHKTSGQAVHT